VIGTLVLSPLADRYGCRNMLLVTVYAFSSGFTSIVTSLGYKPPEAGVIVAVAPSPSASSGSSGCRSVRP
jgi:hypothetical protein